MMDELSALLANYAKESLVTMARCRGLTLPGSKKGQLAQSLSADILHERSIESLLSRLDKRDRAVLDRLLLRGGRVSTVSFGHQLTRAGLVDRFSPPTSFDPRQDALGDPDSRRFEDVIARLTIAGLVLSREPDPEYGGGGSAHLRRPGASLFIPEAVLPHLPVPSLAEPPVVTPAAAAVKEQSASVFQRDLFLYWRYALRNDVALTARGIIAKRHLPKLTDALVIGEAAEDKSGEPELGRTFFIRRLLEDLGLLQANQEKLSASPQSLAFLALPTGERVRRSYHAWLGSKRWNELTRLPGISGDIVVRTIRGATPDPILNARGFVVSLLAKLPAGRWTPLFSLVQQASLVDCDFLIPRVRRPAEPYYRSYGQSRDLNPYESNGNTIGWTFTGLKDDETGWLTVEGGFIGAILREPLHWLGLVGLAFEAGKPAAFRVTELGARLFRGESPPEAPAAVGRVIVQPNFQIFAFDPVGDHILAGIDRFADLVRADQAIEFRLTRDSVYRAQQEGMTVPAIVELLKQVSDAPLPQNVERTLGEWESHHERIVVRRGQSLLHAAHPEMLDALFADGQVVSYLGRRLAPTAALVNHGAHVEALAAALRARDHLPAIDEHGVTKGALTVSRDGRLDFQHRLPSIYHWRRLSPFAEEREGALWLTPSSVRKALARGMGVKQILDGVGGLCRGELPAPVAEQIKVWAKHWGDATVSAVTFLQVKDQAVLSDLLGDPTIGPLLRPFVPQGAVALVQADVDALRAALAAKGIDILDGDTCSTSEPR